VEGYYGGDDITLYLKKSEIDEGHAIVKDIYSEHRIPPKLQNSKYVFLSDVNAKKEFEKRYPTKILYENSKWSILQIGSDKTKN
jgi:hypothetical protein